jgi:hypothetical protein
MLIRFAFAGLLVMLAMPAAAVAGGSPVAYVDQDDPNAVASVCTTPDNPCATIAQGLGEVGSGGIVNVDNSPNPYPGGVSVPSGKSLIALDFAAGDSGDTVIESTVASTPALQVETTGAGDISGFTFRGPDQVVRVSGPATISDNTFDTPGGTNNGDLLIDGGGADVLVEDSTFTDTDTATLFDTGIKIATGMSPTIRDNTLSGHYFGLDIRGAGADPLIERNTIVRTHGAGSSAIYITSGAHPTIRANTLKAQVPGGAGIAITPAFQGQAPGGAKLERNMISDSAVGINAQELQDGELTLDGDLIYGSSQRGLLFTDQTTNPQTPQSGGVTVTGATFADNGGQDFTDIELVNADLVLDSTIVEDPIEVFPAGSGTCTISFSRGPTTTPGGDGCANFQTAASPSFVNAAADDYHLATGSAMIDAGNPIPPPPGALDIDGDARAINGDGACPAVRDIGSDEFVASLSDCTPPDTTITRGPQGTVETPRRNSTALFRFRSEAGSTFRCSLDGRPSQPCESGDRFTVRATPQRKRHVLEVTATDLAGNVEIRPARRAWHVRRVVRPR